jgi:Family of unknown function (DUF6535)
VVRFRLDTIANCVPLLLHASVFLFFIGLVEFLFQTDNTLAHIVLACVVACTVMSRCVALTMLTLSYRNCFYHADVRTALALQLGIAVRSLSFSRRIYKTTAPNWTPRLMDLTEYMGKCKERFLGGLHHDREPSELESFIACIPGFLWSATPYFTPASSILYELLYVNDAHLGLRIGHLFKTQVHTPIACVDALRYLTRWHDVADVLEWGRAFGEATLDSLRVLKNRTTLRSH